MKMIKPRSFVAFALVALSGAALLHTSQNVQHAEARLRALEASVQGEGERVRLLRAEWENLNRPERLERLAKEFLDLAPPSPETLVSGVYALPAAPGDLPTALMSEEGAAGAVLHDAVYEAPAEPGGEQVEKPEKKSASAPAPAPEVALETKREKSFGELIGELSEGPSE